MKVLISEGSSLSARQAIYSLSDRCTMDVLDPSRAALARYSSLVRKVHTCPAFGTRPLEYLQCLAAIIRREKYDVLLPTHDQVYLFSRAQEFLRPWVHLAAPPFWAMQRLENKVNFTRLLEELSLPQPATEVASCEADLRHGWNYPVYVKTDYSTAGQGVTRVENPAEMQQLAASLRQRSFFENGQQAVVQEAAPGVQSWVQAVFQHGQMRAVHSFEARRLGVGGSASARVGAAHPVVWDQVALLGSYLQWHGALFMDYLYDPETGQPQYIEANPRIGEIMNSVLSGVNLCDILVDISLDRDVPVQPHTRPGVRTHNLFMSLMYEALHTGKRRRILGELIDAARCRGIYRDSQDEHTRPGDDVSSILPLLGVSAQLLAWPGSASLVVNSAVGNYSLTATAARTIRALTDEELARILPPEEKQPALVAT